MNKKLFLLFILFFVLYLYCFQIQEKLFQQTYVNLRPIPTTPFLKIATGYAQQLAVEVFFVQSAVFLGGIPQGTDPRIYAPTLAHNYYQITQLYPQFIDPYYFTQSYLAGVTPELTQLANSIINHGRKAYPYNTIYPFFQGFNFFTYLEDPLKAAEIFREASFLPNAPTIFKHLAVILAVEGGDLEAAIISLHIMRNNTTDKDLRKRYTKEIAIFQEAMGVQKAVGIFTVQNQRYPNTLEELVPRYISQLPNFGTTFDLTYNPPRVGLIRPHRKNLPAASR